MIAALALAAALPAGFPAGTPTTIEEIRRDPRQWDGKWVQIEGWINRCWSTDCTVAEKLAARPAGQGMSLSFEMQKSFDDWVRPMLPLHARLVARVDATCLVEVCLDRAPALRQMYVEALETNLKFPDEEQ
jgi:hypothetical protein